MLAIYAPAFEPPEGTSYSIAMAVLAAAALAAFVAVTLCSNRGSSRGGDPPVPSRR